MSYGLFTWISLGVIYKHCFDLMWVGSQAQLEMAALLSPHTYVQR